MSRTSFGARLQHSFEVNGHLCVGIDPHASTLAAWGLPDSAQGAETMARTMLAAASGRVGVIKPQVAFFERHGSAGYLALERLLVDAREAGLLVIGDVKRGEIGSSLDAYADAWLTPGSPLEVDAMTVNPYLGFGSLLPAIDRAVAADKGLFVLAATSNPEAEEVQTARTAADVTVASMLAAQTRDLNAARYPGEPVGSFGIVIGATLALDDFEIVPSALAGTPVLAPGFGFQGAQVDALRHTYGELTRTTLVSQSRSLAAAGAAGVVSAIDRENDLIAEAMR